MPKKALIVLSGYGNWGEELIAPLEALKAANYDIDFVTPKGTKPVALPPSVDETYIDPPLGRGVTTKEMVDKVKAVEKSDLLANPINLSTWFRERPYYSAPFIPGRYTADSYTTGQELIEVLEHGLLRYGW